MVLDLPAPKLCTGLGECLLAVKASINNIMTWVIEFQRLGSGTLPTGVWPQPEDHCPALEKKWSGEGEWSP